MQYSYRNKGFSLFKLGKIEESIECINKSLEINPKYGRAFEVKGLIEESKGNLDESIKYFELALNNIKWDLIAINEIKENFERVKLLKNK